MASSSSAPSPSETPPTNSGATPPPTPSPPSPPPPSSKSPPPESSPPPPPAKESPPPPSKDSHPPPPPPTSSSPSPSPPKSDTSPPPPPPPAAAASPPPTPKSDTSAPPNSPPPPESSATPSLLSPPPPQSIVTPSSNNYSSKKTPSSSSAPGGGGGSNDSLVIIVGVAAGAALLLFIMTLLFLACGRKKKKNHQQQQDNNTYYPAGGPSPASKVGTEYYLYANPPGGFQPQNNNWVKGTPHHHVIKIQMTPPPPPPLASPQTMGLSSAPPMISSSSGEVSPSAGRPPNIGMSQSSLFTYEQLAAATANFAKANILGQGGFGYVFKGVLPDGKEVAVKTLKPGSGQGDREFQAEVEIITRVHHRYLVSLVGYCIDGPKRMLVYEFVPNKTLEYHLHANDRPVMDWPTRLKIALGSAKGLAYLHEDCHPRIIHRDIKASNILLEYNFEAKVSDFGLAKLTSDNNTHVSTRVMGTFGYLAPEYAASGKLTEKSDTFSFGVMLLELITGRRPVDTSNDVMEDSLVDWARPLIDEALVTGDYRQLLDPRLQSNYVPQELASMVVCAGACTRHSARRRPKMGQVVRALEGDLSLDVLKSWNKQQNEEGGGDSGTSSAEYGGSSYSADLRKFRKIAFEQGYSSSEYGATSEYGLNPSSSSSELESQEMMVTATTKKHPT